MIILLHIGSPLKVSTSPSEVTMMAAAGLQENSDGLFGMYLPSTQLTIAAILGANPGSHSKWHSMAGNINVSKLIKSIIYVILIIYLTESQLLQKN